MSKNTEWENLINKMTNPQTSSKTQNSISVINAVFTLALFNGLTALMLMLGNMIAVNAWPEFDAISPGIGYRDAYLISLVIWGWSILRAAIFGAIGATMMSRSNR